MNATALSGMASRSGGSSRKSSISRRLRVLTGSCVVVLLLAFAISVSAAVRRTPVAHALPLPSAPVMVNPPNPPAPLVPVERLGRWFAHGYTLELRSDGTGTFAVWRGAFDGTIIELRQIPVDGIAEVAEVTKVEHIGKGALEPSQTPGLGGLATLEFGHPIPVVHMQWSAGPRRLNADLCPAEGLTDADMNRLRCGA